MNRFHLRLVSLAVIVIVLLALWTKRPGGWFRVPSHSGREAVAKSPDLSNLTFLTPNRVVATVGGVNLRSEDLHEVLQRESDGTVSEAGLSAQDIAVKVGVALDHLIEDELLAEAARRQGIKTHLTGSAARQDLVHQYLALTKIPEPNDADLRSFYKNHGEKFYIPPGARVRELFLPLQGSEGKVNKASHKTKGATYSLGEQLVARIRGGESLEDLAKQYVPDAYRNRAQVHQFEGDVESPEGESQVLALRPGEVAGPLRVEGGYSIFQCVAQIRSGRIPFSQAQEKIRVFLIAKRLEDTRKRLVAELGQQIPVQRSMPKEGRHAIASAP